MLPGLGVFLAIVLHKPLDSYSIVAMMRAANYNNLYCTLVNFAFAMLCPVVIFVTFFMTGGVYDWQDQSMVGYVLAFAAGAFLCISLSDLLPEIQFHTHDRSKLTASLLLGLCFAFCAVFTLIQLLCIEGLNTPVRSDYNRTRQTIVIITAPIRLSATPSLGHHFYRHGAGTENHHIRSGCYR